MGTELVCITAEEARMRAIIPTTVIALACSVAIAAQSPTSPADQSSQTPGNVVTATGCVASGAGVGQFTLTHATLMPAVAMDKDRVPPATGKMDPDHAMSYLLMGAAADLKAHVGHKVSVTGTLVKPEFSKATPPSDRDKASRPMSGGTLNVTAVTMVASTCP